MILAQLIDWSSGPGQFQTAAAAAAAASVHRTDTKALSGYKTLLPLSVS